MAPCDNGTCAVHTTFERALLAAVEGGSASVKAALEAMFRDLNRRLDESLADRLRLHQRLDEQAARTATLAANVETLLTSGHPMRRAEDEAAAAMVTDAAKAAASMVAEAARVAVEKVATAASVADRGPEASTGDKITLPRWAVVGLAGFVVLVITIAMYAGERAREAMPKTPSTKTMVGP
jgi:hypothetical protein